MDSPLPNPPDGASTEATLEAASAGLPDGQELWNAVLVALRQHMARDQFDEFLASTRVLDFDGRLLVVEVPTAYHRSWIIERALDTIYQALATLFPTKVTVELPLAPLSATPDPMNPPTPRLRPRDARDRDRDNAGYRNTGRRSTGIAAMTASAPATPPNGTIVGSGYPANGVGPVASGELLSDSERLPTTPGLRGQLRLNPRYTFDQFVIGESNRFAHAAAQKAADPNSRQFNPLFFYSGVGLGKTHLMQAIAHQYRRVAPEKTVLYVTSEQFVNDFIRALTNGEQMDFRSLYRNVDLLLVDDVQFFINKEQTQAEFFYTFNELYESGRKIIFSSDRPPKELRPLEERLRSRFDWGLTVDIHMPDLETRAAILHKKAESTGCELPREVALFVAERVQSNVRELEGALSRLIAYAGLRKRSIDMDMAVELLGNLYPATSPGAQLTVEDVQMSVCRHFNITKDDLVGPKRPKKLSTARHIAQYLTRKLLQLSYPEIGSHFGQRDHSSVLHACKKVEGEIATDVHLANCISALTRQLGQGDPANRGTSPAPRPNTPW